MAKTEVIKDPAKAYITLEMAKRRQKLAADTLVKVQAGSDVDKTEKVTWLKNEEARLTTLIGRR